DLLAQLLPLVAGGRAGAGIEDAAVAAHAPFPPRGAVRTCCAAALHAATTAGECRRDSSCASSSALADRELASSESPCTASSWISMAFLLPNNFRGGRSSRSSRNWKPLFDPSFPSER